MTSPELQSAQDPQLTPDEDLRLDTLMDTAGKTKDEAWRIILDERKATKTTVGLSAEHVVKEKTGVSAPATRLAKGGDLLPGLRFEQEAHAQNRISESSEDIAAREQATRDFKPPKAA